MRRIIQVHVSIRQRVLVLPFKAMSTNSFLIASECKSRDINGMLLNISLSFKLATGKLIVEVM